MILTPTAEPHPSVVSIPLYDEEQRLYCGNNHPLYGIAEELSLTEVRKQPYVGRTYMQGLDKDRDSGFDHRAMTSHMEAIAILIKSGRYLGYLPEHFARSFVERGEMKNLLGEVAAHFDSFFLAHRRDERNRASIVLAECLVGALTVPDRKA